TVPAGWNNEEDWPVKYVLSPQSSDGDKPTFDGGGLSAISLWTQQVPARLDAACNHVNVPGAGRTIDEILGQLRSEPDLAIGAATAITIDGHHGKAFDLALAVGAHSPCATEDKIVTPLFQATNDLARGYPGLGYSRMAALRIILLDIGASPLWIVMETPGQAQLGGFVDQAMPVIQSFRFGP